MFFFFNDTATTEIYTLSLHDALPISALPPRPDRRVVAVRQPRDRREVGVPGLRRRPPRGRAPGLRGPRAAPRQGAADRKSTRLNSSHANISYAVFCLKKKKNQSPFSI